MGNARCKQWCARDGGEQIFATTHADGYPRRHHEYFCWPCIETLAQRGFRYVDVQTGPIGQVERNYFRYTLGSKGDVSCETWVGKKPDADRLMREVGVRDDECVVVATLSERPVEYVLAQQVTSVSNARTELWLNQWTVVDERSGQLLARVNDYQFTSKLSAALDMSGHGGNPDESCMKGTSYVRSVTTLATRVLHDTD